MQVEEQQLINQRGHADASDAERDALNAQLSAAQEQLRELKDKHTRAGVAHSEYTAKMKELEEQLIKQVHSYHADLRAAMTATACCSTRRAPVREGAEVCVRESGEIKTHDSGRSF